jgi:triosephosphate isomerase
MRLKIIAANWKMNKNFEEGLQLATEVVQQLQKQAPPTAQVVLMPSFVHLAAVHSLLPVSRYIHLGAQNCHECAHGAFTGEVSAPMLRSVGVRFVLLGHSERRQYFGEDHAMLAQKVTTAFMHGLRPIFCCGEPKHTREAGQQIAFVQQQLTDSLFHLTGPQMEQVVIAYEPIWAIGTGITPTPAEVQDMHEAIRNTVAEKYGETIAQNVPILYGGSCDAHNAPTFFACPDVDGGLIGGASLQANSFIAVVNSLK